MRHLDRDEAMQLKARALSAEADSNQELEDQPRVPTLVKSVFSFILILQSLDKETHRTSRYRSATIVRGHTTSQTTMSSRCCHPTSSLHIVGCLLVARVLALPSIRIRCTPLPGTPRCLAANAGYCSPPRRLATTWHHAGYLSYGRRDFAGRALGLLTCILNAETLSGQPRPPSR